MTAEERNEYNRLNRNGRQFYDMYASMHPDWNHVKLMTMVTVCLTDPFKKDGKRTVKEILVECIARADQFMESNFPRIYPQVRTFFANVADAVRRAAVVTWQWLTSLFSNI